MAFYDSSLDSATLVDIIREKDLEILRLKSQVKKLEEDNQRLNAKLQKNKKDGKYGLSATGKARKPPRNAVTTNKVIDAGSLNFSLFLTIIPYHFPFDHYFLDL